MPLTVKVIRYKGQPPIEHFEASYEKDGFTIGRSDDKQGNHLFLPDPKRYISRNHASISFKNGAYILTDSSVEGTFFLNKNLRVCREAATLSDKERIKIGDYELIVHISSVDNRKIEINQKLSSTEKNGFFFDAYRDQPKDQAVSGKYSNANESNAWPNDVDFFQGELDPPGVSEQYEDSPLNDAYEPSNIVDESAPRSGIPDDFNFEELVDGLEADANHAVVVDDSARSLQKKDSQESIAKDTVDLSVPNQRVDAADMNHTAGDNAALKSGQETKDSAYPHSDMGHPDRKQIQLELLHIFLKAAGLNDTSLGRDKDIPAVMEVIGKVYFDMIKGLMMILRGRSELKTQIQVPVTQIKPVENNPLKFYQSAEEAIKQLITKDQHGFLDAQEAVREGLTDIMNHQIAMTAGVQTAVINLIEQLNPQNYVKRFEKGVVFPKKAKAWDSYCQAYSKIADGALEDFLGERFGRAYEAQIRKLQSNTKDP